MNERWIGHALGGRYEIDSLLGQGGMSAVYRATDRNLRRVVAVKMIHPHLSNNPDFIQRFESEAAVVAQLRHPNIVQVFDFDHVDDVYFMVLEFIPGETLQERLRRLAGQDRLLSVEEVIRFSTSIAQAMDYAHKRGLIHRDIKPANVMLDVHGDAILTDFGIARIVGENHFTATGEVLGTAHYMSPEQIEGDKVDHRTDIYAMGVMLYEMVSSRLPFDADSALTVMRMHLQDPVPDLSEISPGTPPTLRAAIMKALEKDPANRFASAAEMVQALGAVSAGKPISALAPADQTMIEAPSPGADTDEVEPITDRAAAFVEDAARRPEWIGATVVEAAALPPISRDPAALDTAPPQPGPPAGPGPQSFLARVPVWGWGIGAVLLLALLLLALRPWRWISSGSAEAQVTPAPTVETAPTEAVALMPSATQPPTAEPTPEPTPTPIPLLPVTRLNAGQLSQTRILGHGTFISAARNPDGQTVAIGGSLGIWVYDLADPTTPLQLEGHTDRVGSVAWSPDGSRLASGSDDTTVRIWDPLSGAALRTLAGHTRRVRTVDWSADGRYLISGGSDGEIRIWDPESGEQREVLSGNTLHVWSVAWSPTTDEFAWGGADGLVRVQAWDGSIAGTLRTLRGHSGNVWQVHWSRDGTQLASVGEDGTVRVWDAAGGVQLASTSAGGNWVAELGYDSAESILNWELMDGQITVQQLPDQTPLFTASGFVDWITHLAWAPDGAWIAGASLDGTVRIWDAGTGEETGVLTYQAGPVTGLAVRHSGQALAIGSPAGSWEIWEGSQGWEVIFQGSPLVAGIADMAWSPDDRYLAMAGADGMIAVWDTQTESAQTLTGHQAGVNGLAWSPAGEQLASASADNSVRIWNVPGFETSLVLTGHSDAVTALEWSPDGRQLATVTTDGRVRMWDPIAGRVNLVIEEGLQLLAVTWSPDGELLVTGSTDGNDGIVTVWDAASGVVLRELLGHRSAVTSVGWGPEGARLASGSREGAIRVWGLPGD